MGFKVQGFRLHGFRIWGFEALGLRFFELEFQRFRVQGIAYVKPLSFVRGIFLYELEGQSLPFARLSPKLYKP